MTSDARRPLAPIIDVHAHAMLASWYDFMASRSAPQTPRIEGVAIPDWTPEAAIAAMDETGIAAMVLSNPIGTKDLSAAEALPLARKMNEEIADVLARYPTRFGAFAVVPLQDVTAAVAELEYALDTLKFDGVCLQTNFDGVYPGDPRLEPIFAALDERASTAFVHPAGAPYMRLVDIPVITGLVEFAFDTTRAIVSLVCSGTRRRYPKFNYIATHGGGTLPYLANRIAFVIGRRGTGFQEQLTTDEIMEGLKSLHYDLTIATAREQLQALRMLLPVDQMLLGFDYPMAATATIRPALDKLVASEVFDASELDKIARGNALKLLPRLAGRLKAAVAISA